LLESLAQGHDGGHVALVEGGEHRRGALSLDEALGDALAQGAHLLAPAGPRRARARRGGAGRLVAGTEVGEHVLLADAPGGAGGPDAGEIDALLAGDLAGERCGVEGAVGLAPPCRPTGAGGNRRALGLGLGDGGGSALA